VNGRREADNDAIGVTDPETPANSGSEYRNEPIEEEDLPNIIDLDAANAAPLHTDIKVVQSENRSKRRDINTDESDRRRNSPDSEIPQQVDRMLNSFGDAIRAGYGTDMVFKNVISSPELYCNYQITPEGFLRMSKSQRLCIPRSKTNDGKDLRELIIQHFHEVLGHLGYKKTVSSIRSSFFWPEMASDILDYCTTCPQCQALKTGPPTRLQGLHHPLPAPSRPWESIAMDFIGPLPTSHIGEEKFNNLWVIVDRFSSMVHLIPTTTTVTAEQCGRLYLDNVFRLHGLPLSIVSDRDAKFTGAFWKKLHQLLGTDLLMSTAYHPQTDGKTEKTNSTVLQILRNWVNSQGTDWAQHLPRVEFAFNSAEGSSTKQTPFQINYGFSPRHLPPISIDDDVNPQALDYLEGLYHHQAAAQDMIEKSRILQKVRTDHGRIDVEKDTSRFVPGDMVYRLNEGSRGGKGKRKMRARWLGPHRILESLGNNTYLLANVPSRVHPVFNISKLRMHKPNNASKFPNRAKRRPEVVKMGDLNEQIRRIVDHRRSVGRNGKYSFLVEWDGYGYEDRSLLKKEFPLSPPNT
jgi:transposase InsO family protein